MTYQYIIEILQKYDHHFDDKQLNQAIKFLLKYDHNNNHALKISKTLISIYPDTKSVITSLLFFNSIKNNLKLTHIKHHCDEEIAMIFFSLAKLFRIQNTYYNTTQETLQLFLSLNPHLIIRVLLIRFAYLLHKLRFNCTISDIEYYLMSEEIKDIYVSLFQEITLEKINNALQNVCLEILHPQLYKFITNFLKENYPNQSVIKVINSFHDILSRLDLAYTISGRVKSTYSIAQKLVNKSNVINNLCDIIGIRVIVEQDNECYQVLNTILNDYAHVPNKNKNFIKFPKQNNYQSLHAIIIDKDLRKLEVQIRTKRMHHIAQFGSASHMQYKTNLHNSNNLNIAYNILNKIIFNTLNQYIPTILHQYLRSKRLDSCISYIIGLIKPNHRTLKQDVFIDHENMLYYRYKSTVYTDHSIDLDLDINNSIDRLHSPNIYVIPKMSYQVLLSTNYHYKHEVIINCQKYNVEIVGRKLIQGGDTTHTVGQLPSEQMEYNLSVSNISALKQTVSIVNIIHTAKNLIGEDLLQGNVGKCSQKKIHPDVDSKNFKTNSGTALFMAINLQDADMVQLLLTHPNISINERSMCIAQSTSIKDGDLPFLLAVHNGNLEIVEKLFAYPKLDIYQINNNKEHALIIATQLGNIEMLRLLVSYLYKEFQDNIEEFERYLNLTNSEGQSALYFAFDYFGFDPCISIKMIKILLSITNQDGDSLVQESKTIDITAKLHELFFQEILNGHRDTVAELITITQNNKLVIDVNKSNMTDEYSSTALLMAINLQDADMVQLLLTHPNIDINRSFTYDRAANINGDIYTVHPFLEALSSNDRIIDLFLKDFDKNKIEILEVDKHGQVCVDNSNEIIIKSNQNSESALMIAIKYGDIDILIRLINILKIKLTNDHFKQYLNYVEPFEGNNVLTLAGQQGNKLIVQALLCLQEKDGVPLINMNHQDYCGNRVQHYFTDDQELQYQFRQHDAQGLSTPTLKNVITNPQSTHYADEAVKKHIAKLQDTFKNQLTKQDIDQSVQELLNYLEKLDNDYTLCLKDFEDSTISVKCRTTTNVESVSRHMSIKLVPKVVKKLLQHKVESHDTLRAVLHLVWLMMKKREKTDNPQNLNFKIDLIKNLNQVAFEYTHDDVTELNVQTMKPPCMKGICNALISSAMPTVPLINYDEGEKAPGYFAQHPELVKEYLQATTEYTQCEISTAEFSNTWQGMLNKFCPNYTNDDKIVWYDELEKINFILNQSEFLEIWSDIMVIIEDIMNNENKWNKSDILQLLNKQYNNVIMIHQNIEKFLQAEQPQLLQAIKNSELYPIRQLVSKNQDCDIITNIVFMFVIHNADIEMAQSLIECKNKDGTPLIQTEYAEMAQDESEQDQGIEQEHLGMLQVFLLVEYLYAKKFDQDKAEKLLMLSNNNNKPLIDTQAADVILQCVHYDGGSVPKSAEETILIHENLGTYTEHTCLLGDNIY